MRIRLKGSNRIGSFRKAAERIVSKITVSENVSGVIFLGGLARGFADKYSDVDIIVLIDKEDQLLRREIHHIALEEQENSGLDVDLETHYLRAFQRWKWDETDRWDFSHSRIVYDPMGEISRLFNLRLRVPERFWVKRIVTNAEYMKWYCCPSESKFSTITEAWIDRGDLLSAHYCLTYATDLLLRTVFALNREFLPPPKWRIFYFRNLKWLPANHRLLEEVINLKGLTVADLNRRLEKLRELWQAVLVKIKEETGLTSDQMTKQYVERVLHQTPFR